MKPLELVNGAVRQAVVYSTMKGLDMAICVRVKEGMMAVQWHEQEMSVLTWWWQ